MARAVTDEPRIRCAAQEIRRSDCHQSSSQLYNDNRLMFFIEFRCLLVRCDGYLPPRCSYSCGCTALGAFPHAAKPKSQRFLKGRAANAGFAQAADEARSSRALFSLRYTQYAFDHCDAARFPSSRLASLTLYLHSAASRFACERHASLPTASWHTSFERPACAQPAF